jgi:Immunoglobulin domain
MKTYTTKTAVSPATRLRNLIFGGFQTLAICSAIVLSSSSAARADRTFFADGSVINWANTDFYGSFSIENGTTINVTNGVTITLTRSATYDTSYLATEGTNSAFLNLSGSGRIEFAQEMAFALSDQSGGPGVERVLNMSGTSYMNPATLYVGQRADCVLNITDSAMIDVRTDGELYTPDIRVAKKDYGFKFTATINQSGNSIIQSLGSGMSMGDENTAIYNMSGGQLILGGPITGAGADDQFNFTGGTIILKGGDYRDITDPANAVWFSGGKATFDGTDTTIVPPDPLITAQPQSVATAPGTTATLSVTATGTGTLTYQWQQNGTNRVGQTSATLSLPNVALTDAGSWSCVVTGTLGTNTSRAATLTVNAPPAEPIALNIYPGLTVTGTVGKNYGVEYADALTPNRWLTLTNFNPLPASPIFVLDPTPGTLASRFYRLVLLP